MNSTMNCQQCQKIVADIKDLCFYIKQNQEVHLILKHEMKAKYIDVSIKLIESENNKKNIKKINCSYCKNINLACECPFGPDKTPFIGFITQNLILKNKYLTKNDKWSTLLPQYSEIEKKNDSNFYGTFNVQNVQQKQEDESIQFRLPDPSKKQDFEWKNILIKKQPRQYQIEAFVEVLLNDIIVVLPTGQGKTLIASLFLKKMKQINKEHLGLLIAERIPLVHQQGASIEADTGLRVCSMTGENRNVKKLHRLLNGAYDTLVITAGVLVDMIQKKELTYDMFSAVVFDECHHAQGNHLYCKLLYDLKQLIKKPRILGLTASPFKAKGYDHADNELKKILNMFQGAKFFIPNNDFTQNQSLNWIIANLTDSQNQFQDQVFKLFQNQEKKQKELDVNYQPEKIIRMDKISYPRIMGKLNQFQDSYNILTQQRQKENIDYLKLILESIILQETMGVKYGLPSINESSLTKTLIKVNNPNEISNRLVGVQNMLKNCNKNERILIFVDTRLVATNLTDLLIKEFPQLNPQKIVGHGGYDGMQWEQEQNKVVEKFRTGNSRLIVSTSVLEEGIDVPECDIVLRFTGIKSLIQYIQSRGRARKQSSKFFVICNPKEKELAENIINQEKIMNLKLAEYKQKFMIPSKQAVSILKELEIDKIDFNLQRKQEIQFFPEKSKNTITMELFVENKFSQNQNIYKIILNSLSYIDNITVKRLEIFDDIQNDINYKFSRIFKENEIQALCCIQIKNSKNNDFLDFYEFAKQWDFKVDGCNAIVNFINPSIDHYKFDFNKQIKQNMEILYFDNIYQKQTQQSSLNQDNDLLKIDELSIGNFFDRTIFYTKYSFGCFQLQKQNGQRYLMFKKNQYYSGIYKLRVPFQSINGFGICALNDRGTNISIFLPIQNAPYLFDQVAENMASNLVCDPDILDFDDLYDFYDFDFFEDETYLPKLIERRISRIKMNEIFQNSKVIRLSITLDQQGDIFKKIQKIFVQNDLLPLPMFFSKILISEDSEIINDKILNYNALLDKIQVIQNTEDSEDSEATQATETWEATEATEAIQLKKTLWNLKILESKNWFQYDITSLEFILNQIYKMFQQGKMDTILIQAQAISLINPKCYWGDIKEMFQNLIQQLSDNQQNFINYSEKKLSDNYELIKRIVITPLKIIYQEPIPMQKSRLLRMYGQENEFIQVSFRDENFQKLRGKVIVRETIFNFIRYGIDILGKNYKFFCASASQMRDHKAYFMQAQNQNSIDEIRAQIILDDKKFDSTAKYLSRLGLFCSGDLQALEIPHSNYEIIPDLYAENDDLLTDGSGIIPYQLLQKIIQNERLGLNQNVSAIQIRYAGFKGVLLAAQAQSNIKNIQFRKSMKKFENLDTNLCIVRGANYIPLTLNRQVITLLTSLKKSQKNLEEYIYDIQEKYLQDASDSFTDKKIAFQLLKKNIDLQFLSDVLQNIEFIEDPFWFNLIKLNYSLQTKFLTEKSKIPLEKACMLMGVPDPLQILAENEIFFQFQKQDQNESTIIIGNVLIYRNPCLNPGDIRLVKAVDNILLHQWTNVLLFPVKNCKRSLAADCSGGDLDGDIFSIIWDANIVPPQESIQKPFDYSSLSINIPKNENPKKLENIADFYIECVCNDILGRVSNMHLALSDILDEGACHPLSIELSMAQSQAVDFPKTGIVPEIPKEISKILNEKGYPDFMEISGKQEYISNKLLGKLYRRCLESVVEFDKFDNTLFQIKIDLKFQLNGHEDYLKEAKQIYQSYSYHMQRIMSYFDLNSESEIILSTALKWHYTLQGDKKKAGENLKDYYQNLKRIYRNIFFKENLNQEETFKKASAWYVAAYSLQQENKYDNSMFLSFPWVIGDILCRILEKQNKMIENQQENYEISKSILTYFFKQQNIFQKNLQEKNLLIQKVKKQIENQVKIINQKMNKKFQFQIQSYGSSSIFVNRDDSDLDICIIPSQEFKFELQQQGIFEIKQQNRYILENIISIALNDFCETKDEHYQTEFPYISCKICLEKDEQFDISLNINGLQKTQIIIDLYQQNSFILPYFQFLVEWARCIGLIKQSQTNKGIIPSAEFYLILVNQFKDWILNQKLEINLNDINLYDQYNHLTQNIKNQQKNEFLEQHIILFFEKYSKLSEKITLKWPFIEQKIIFEENTILHIATYAKKSLVILKALKNIQYVLNYALDQTLRDDTFMRILPLSLSLQLKPFDFHKAKLQKLTGAQIFFEKTKNLQVKLIGKGSKLQINNLKKEVQKLINYQHVLKNGKLAKNTNNYFAENCTLYHVKYSKEAMSRVIFKSSPLCPCQFFHILKSKSQLQLQKNFFTKDWQELFQERLTNKIHEQLNIYFQTRKSSKHGVLKINVRYGVQYFLEIEKKISSTQSSISIEDLQLSISRSYQNKNKKIIKEWEYTEKKNQSKQIKKYDVDDKQEMKQILYEQQINEQKHKKQKQNQSFIKSAFCPGLLLDNFEAQQDIEKCLNIYRQALKNSEFIFQNDTEQKYYMKVKLKMTKSLVVEILLNKNMEVIEYYISPLKWVNCIIFDGQLRKLDQILDNHDIRISIHSKNLFNESTDLFKAIFKDSQQQSPIYMEDNRPKIRKQIQDNPNLKNSVFHARIIQKNENFTMGTTRAIIQIGKEYYGPQLELEKNVTELQFKFDCSHITEENYSFNLIKELSNLIFVTSIRISDEINNFIKNFK